MMDGVFEGAKSDFVDDFWSSLVKVHSMSNFILGAKVRSAWVVVTYGPPKFSLRF